jgi:valyl-tRNA synthetase
MENIRDWCISRQLWWGHGSQHGTMKKVVVYVAESLEALHREQPETVGLSLRQDEDCLDTWFLHGSGHSRCLKVLVIRAMQS